MTWVQAVGASVIASVVLGACGGDDGNKPLPPSSATPVAHKERTLTRAEYPPMREWIVADDSSSDRVRAVCVALDAAPDTPVIGATRNACDRFLAIVIEVERINDVDVASECAPGDYECGARILRPLHNQFVNLKRVVISYHRDINAAMEDGPCRDVLTPSAFVEKLDRLITTFDDALEEFSHGNAEPLRAFANDDFDDDVDDATPCRPS